MEKRGPLDRRVEKQGRSAQLELASVSLTVKWEAALKITKKLRFLKFLLPPCCADDDPVPPSPPPPEWSSAQPLARCTHLGRTERWSCVQRRSASWMSQGALRPDDVCWDRESATRRAGLSRRFPPHPISRHQTPAPSFRKVITALLFMPILDQSRTSRGALRVATRAF